MLVLPSQYCNLKLLKIYQCTICGLSVLLEFSDLMSYVTLLLKFRIEFFELLRFGHQNTPLNLHRVFLYLNFLGFWLSFLRPKCLLLALFYWFENLLPKYLCKSIKIGLNLPFISTTSISKFRSLFLRPTA